MNTVCTLIDRIAGPGTAYGQMADTASRALLFAGVVDGADSLVASAVAEQVEMAAKRTRDYWRGANDYLPRSDSERLAMLDRLAAALRGFAQQQEAA